MNRGGVHTSCCECPPPPPPPPPPSGKKNNNGCFPGTAQVILETGKSATMSELQIGDKVQTGMKHRFSYIFLIFFKTVYK